MSSVTIKKINDKIFWDDFIFNSENGTVFHQYDWLAAAANHSGMKLTLLVVSKGDKPVCVLPLFKGKKAGIRVLLSPPNSCGIPFLGPAFNLPSSNRYNAERTFLEIIEEIVKFAKQEIGYDFFRIINTPNINDIRPYKWLGFSVNTSYTYRFELKDDSQKIHDEFHRTTRNVLQKAQKDSSLEITNENKNSEEILKMLRERYRMQGKKFKISSDYFRQLMDSSINENIEVIAVLSDKQFAAGDIALVFKKDAFAWLGTVNRDIKTNGIGELVLWEKIKDLSSRGINTYDIVGANTPHICKHKSKYGADLITYYDVFDTSFKGKVALKLLKLWGKKIS